MTGAEKARRSKWRRFIVALASTCAALVLAEIACRVDAFFPHSHWDSARARQYFETRAADSVQKMLEVFAAPDPAEQDSSLRPMPHPFTGWTDPRSAAQTADAVRHFASPEGDAHFDVLVLGGSVAAQLANYADQEISAAIAGSPRVAGRPVRVWNQGRSAYKEPQPALLFEWLLQMGWKPDLVLLVDGFNEAAIASSNAHDDAYPLYPFIDHWISVSSGRVQNAHALDLLVDVRLGQRDVQSLAQRALAVGAWRSALLTRIFRYGMVARADRYELALSAYHDHLAAHASDEAVGGPALARDDAAVAELVVHSWTESARSVQASCSTRGIVCLHVLQPTLFDPGAKTATPEELHRGVPDGTWSIAVRRHYPLLRAACAQLEREGLSMFDATRIFVDDHERRYVDVCHLDETGYHRFAAAISARLVQLLR